MTEKAGSIGTATGQDGPSHAPVQREQSSGTIRPVERNDLEKIARLFLDTFYRDRKHRKERDIERVAAYMDRLYLQGPYSADGVNSLVQVNASGDVGGFLGLQKTRYILDGQTLSGCIIGSLMSMKDPQHSRVGAQLLWALHGFDFDLILTDSANRRSLAFAAPLKYRTIAANCLEWVYPLQPASMSVQRLRERWPSAPSVLLKPAEVIGERILRKYVASKLTIPATIAGTSQITDREGFARAAQACASGFRLRPEWDRPELDWLLRCAEDTHRQGPLHYRVIHDRNGARVGCYAFYGQTGKPAKALQILAMAGSWGLVLDDFVRTAHALGCNSVVGQAHEALLPHLYRFPGMLFYYSGGCLIRTADHDLIQHVASQEILVGGLAGDRWTRLSSGEI